jgi:MFS transporter, DHA1 family, multidrug resistance protein
MSLAMPNLTLFALDPFPEQRGLAASCQTFFQSVQRHRGGPDRAGALGLALRPGARHGRPAAAGGLAALAHRKLRLLPG